MFLKQKLYILSVALLLIHNAYSQDQLKAIDAIQNDSIALRSLQSLSGKTSDLRTRLNINLRIIYRASLLQKFPLALSIGNENLMIAKKNSFDSLEAAFYKMIGVTNYFMDQRKAAIPYFEKALEIAQKNNYWELAASCHNNIGGAYADIQEYDQSEANLLRSLEIMKDHGRENNPVALRTLRVLARVYSAYKKEKEAEAIYLSLIEKSKATKDTALLCDNLIFYSEMLRDRGELEKAISMSGQALEYYKAQNSHQGILLAMAFHGANLLKAGHYKEAYELTDERELVMRKGFKKDLEKEIGELEVKYKTAQLKQEKEFAEIRSKKQKQIYLLSIAGLMLVAGSGIFIWGQRKRSKHLKELANAEKARFKDVIEAEEKERSRIAQELHDGLGQLLSTARLNVAGLEDGVGQEDKPNLDRSLKIIDDACVEVRSISHNLMPSALIRLGLIPAITELVNNVNSAKSIRIDFNTNFESSLGKSLDITIYRVVQEILNNMIRHAKATNIKMNIEKTGDDLKIALEDNGVGFNPEELNKSRGIGWKNIFSRISMLNGDIKVESELQKGTMVFIHLKLRNG